jgi:2,3-bisphosphoglycerate-independent phosphoglycerate mutase
MGNSEVGHQNLGAGRVTWQDFMRINLAIRDGSFFHNPVLVNVMAAVRQGGRRLHLMGLLSDGGVHSHIDHLSALLELARQQGLGNDQVVVHAIMDGRDTPPTSGASYLGQLEQELRRVGVGRIGTVIGRYYSMDRDNHWERTDRAYAAYVTGSGMQAVSAAAAIQASYAAERTDEFVEPSVIVDQDDSPVGRIGDGDGVICFNFRPDRARQITRCFVHAAPEGAAKPPLDVHYVCMTQYDASFHAPFAFAPETVWNPIGQVVAEAGLRQLRIAETEKYAHVTYFFNGGREEPFANEDRALIRSSRVATYDLQPEMSAPGITGELLRRLEGGSPYDLVVLNFANADMVGHTGLLEATIRAVEVVDDCVGQIVERVGALGGTTLITADHGNAEQMMDDGGGPLTAHTTNPVHLILVDQNRRTTARLRNGIFADVAPTMLGLLGLSVPADMTGRSLLI